MKKVCKRIIKRKRRKHVSNIIYMLNSRILCGEGSMYYYYYLAIPFYLIIMINLGKNIISLILKINNYYTTKLKKFTVNAYEKYLKND